MKETTDNINPPTVVVGMSGGVDSSVSALLLKQQGYKVIGLFMKNWEEERDGACHASQDAEDVHAVCELLDIPCYTIQFTQEYREKVFARFLEDLQRGETPNPDILCNREIKFSLFYDKALALGADYLATGHYCRVLEQNGSHKLARGVDATKDQSYFVYTLSKEKLQRILFPVGGLLKSEVRRLAHLHKLPTATKKESMGICFIGKRDFKTFVNQYIAYTPGDMITPEGAVVGRHDGIAYYTIGQRRGLGIGGEGEAWFVAGKRVEENKLIVVQGENHPALYKNGLVANEVSWVEGTPPSFPFSCTAKIRYRQSDFNCTIIRQEGDLLRVHFDSPQKAVTPRQSIVFYLGELCLGGASIVHALDDCSVNHAECSLDSL